MKHLQCSMERCCSHQSLLYWGGKYKCAINDLVFMEVQAHFYRKKRFLRTGVLRGKKFTAELLQVSVQRQHVAKEDKRSFDDYRCKSKPLIKSFISVIESQTQIHTLPSAFLSAFLIPSPAPNLTPRA